jgi:hypothetical protein
VTRTLWGRGRCALTKPDSTDACRSDGVGCSRDDCNWPDQPCAADGDAKGDGETWEAYAHRLEGRIKQQRHNIKELTDLRGQAGDKRARLRINRLERLLGQKEARLANQHDGLRALAERVTELEAQREALWEEIRGQ